ncbi:hypothetical protein LCGC14_1403000 [marine sediment metagenome]|uniref:Uncharacterized protein n=1 Tax=marine sediment metagenome TaxID=412755 RepID=A0A0F9MBV8_9ZZZZ
MSELWEVEQDKDNGRDCWNVCEGDQVVFTCYSAFIADRVALEHNVFRSMSDEQVKELATNMVTYYALRADLNEAVGLLRWTLGVVDTMYHERFNDKLCAFLNRHMEGK